jgi:hypothetical protein
MANTSHIFGFRPKQFTDSSAYNGQSVLYFHSSGQANNTYKGDLVAFDATNRGSGLADAYKPLIPAVLPVVAARTTSTFRGVAVGFVPQPEYNMTATASLGTTYLPASANGYMWVVDDCAVVFEAEESGNSYVSDTSNAINKNIDISYTAGSQTTGVSGVVLDATTAVTNAVKPFRVLRYSDRVDNFGFTASDTNSRAHLDVMIMNSDLYLQGTNLAA